MEDFLKPVTNAPSRPGLDEGSDEESLNLGARILYLRSYLFMRTVIGAMGIVLPVALLLGDGFIFKATEPARGSLSAYYFTGMRDVFVGSLCVTGLFLVTYKVFERTVENVLSMVAGVAALGVALFSTSRPGGVDIPLTPLQDRLGESTVRGIHFFSAVLFIGCLAVISVFFGMREGARKRQRSGHRARFSPATWRRFHWGCAAGIGLAVVFIGVTKFAGWVDEYSLLIGEAVAVLAFGLSWLAKGLELDYLVGPQAVKEAGARQRPAAGSRHDLRRELR